MLYRGGYYFMKYCVLAVFKDGGAVPFVFADALTANKHKRMLIELKAVHAVVMYKMLNIWMEGESGV